MSVPEATGRRGPRQADTLSFGSNARVVGAADGVTATATYGRASPPRIVGSTMFEARVPASGYASAAAAAVTAPAAASVPPGAQAAVPENSVVAGARGGGRGGRGEAGGSVHDAGFPQAFPARSCSSWTAATVTPKMTRRPLAGGGVSSLSSPLFVRFECVHEPPAYLTNGDDDAGSTALAWPRAAPATSTSYAVVHPQLQRRRGSVSVIDDRRSLSRALKASPPRDIIPWADDPSESGINEGPQTYLRLLATTGTSMSGGRDGGGGGDGGDSSGLVYGGAEGLGPSSSRSGGGGYSPLKVRFTFLVCGWVSVMIQ